MKGRVKGAWTVEAVDTRLMSMAAGSSGKAAPDTKVPGGRRLGIRVPETRKLAREIGTDHDLALKLWDSGIHEARILAAFLGDPELLTSAQMDRLASEIETWDVCDNICGLFFESPLSQEKITAWSESGHEFTRRAAFVMIAYYAVHRKDLLDGYFEKFFPVIVRASDDGRRYVKQGVDWALRQIGKRSMPLNVKAREVAAMLKNSGSRPAAWIGSNSLRELASESVQARLMKKMEQKKEK